MDHQGGELDVAGVHLQVPAGALDTGRIVSLRVSTDPDIEGPFSEQKNLRLTPFVQVGPENLVLAKPVFLIIPHCAFTSGDPTGVDVYSGVLKTSQLIFVLPCSLILCFIRSAFTLLFDVFTLIRTFCRCYEQFH